jgi:GH15 family glucan-1,4-alpha-glucosidase
MPLRLEDYALIGDTHTAALVGFDGSIDWLCLPRLDSDACFAALLGDRNNGCWRLAPAGAHRATGRRYRDDTLVLETGFATDSGTVRIVDCMPIRTDGDPQVIRLVEGVSGTVEMTSTFVLRPNYGRAKPWLTPRNKRVHAVVGPHDVALDGDVVHEIDDSNATARATFTVEAGDMVALRMSWVGRRTRPATNGPSLPDAVAGTERWWRRWSDRCDYAGEHRDAYLRSLITLKALTFAPSGGLAAAATTSLPESLGGVRNWDYRYCWLRDATYALLSLLHGGYTDEAAAWRDWLVRAVAGHPEQLQIMYGLGGERRLVESEIPWLAGYALSAPVRVGNAAHEQLQLDVFGEVMDALHQARTHDIAPDDDAWHLQVRLLHQLESLWQRPDNGLWEVRGQRRHFVHSKVMCWVAFDRGVQAVERFGMDGPAEQWRTIRDTIFDEVCERGFNGRRRSFTQYYGSHDVDASLLLIPQVGFLPVDDPRVQGTIAAVERDLTRDGFVQRYPIRDDAVDGLPGGEGAFLMCTLWLANCYALADRHDDARDLVERVIALSSSVGLLSEEYDTQQKRLIGNFPQAYSHVGIATTLQSLYGDDGPAQRRASAASTASA